MTTTLPSLYQQVIHQSRYSRFRDDFDPPRRENWSETLDRWAEFWIGRQPDHKDAILMIRDKIENLYDMPSMRSLMTAGAALDRDEVASFNCAFTVIDSLRAFDELMYILMCGTGIGFSVQSRYVNKLPEIAEEFTDTETTIVVPDSKIGWASSFKELLSLLAVGKIPRYDLSKIRPKGARLKTFGGRASGPEPLEDLFIFAIDLFRNAAGRKLSTLECHDLACKIADIVVVGGVRRSALISLSDLSDDKMRNCKSGAYWEHAPQRRLANNSYVAEDRPDFTTFLEEWTSLYKSYSGERGIFSLPAARKVAARNGRRDPDQIVGTNPCVIDTTWIQTDQGPKQVKDLIRTPFNAIVEGESYLSPTGFVSTGVKPTYQLTTSRGYSITLTDNHPLLKITKKTRKVEKTQWTEAKDLKEGDSIKLSNHHQNEWDGKGSFNDGYMIGQIVGDGGFVFEKSETKNHQAYVRFYTEADKKIAPFCLDYVHNLRGCRSDVKIVSNGIYDQVKSTSLYNLCQEFGVSDHKELSPEFEKTSSNFYRGFLSGFFDADGTLSTTSKSTCCRYSQSNIERLTVVQRMLSRLGVASTVYKNRRKAGKMKIKGGQDYERQALHELHISKDNLIRFLSLIDLKNEDKIASAIQIQSSYSKGPYTDNFIDTIESIEKKGSQRVYDCTVNIAHEFDANGIRAHNCAEILLRDKEMCNLSEVVVRPEDTLETLKEKVEIATVIGTLQSTLTNFRYLRKKWRDNCEEERLLGVSLTGICDNTVMSGQEGEEKLISWLEEMNAKSVEVNKEWADKLGIPQSTAITTVKPSGTVSQLVDSASGIHPRFSKYYIRRIRQNREDPLCDLLIDEGVPHEVDRMDKSSYVFSFPIKSPEDSITANEMGAMRQLRLWQIYAKHWCEHKPSMTCYYTDSEFLDVGNWIWNNFDEVSGVSFLPYDDHIYPQAPYEPVNEEKYNELVAAMPESIDWTRLQDFEVEDHTTGLQELACSAGGCEI